MKDIDQILRDLEEKYPLVPHTGRGRLYSTVRRMKAEKELGIPIDRRTGFAISVKYGKPANELSESQWNEFFLELGEDLKQKYPDLHARVFE